MISLRETRTCTTHKQLKNLLASLLSQTLFSALRDVHPPKSNLCLHHFCRTYTTCKQARANITKLHTATHIFVRPHKPLKLRFPSIPRQETLTFSLPLSLPSSLQDGGVVDEFTSNVDRHLAKVVARLQHAPNAVLCAERCSSPQVQSLLASLLSHIHHTHASARKHHTPGTRARPEHEPEAAQATQQPKKDQPRKQSK